MTGETHYDLEILAELAEGLLDATTAQPVRDHLAVCDPCGERLADLAAVREVLAATPTPAMPMGVALRIDQAIAAEARSRGSLTAVAEAPDWDRIMADSPWEQAAPVEEPALEPVRLGVVADDGTVVPSTVPARRARARGRRRWAMPATAVAAAAVVMGSAVVATSMFSASGGGTTPTPSAVVAEGSASVGGPAKVPAESTMRMAYKVTESEWNYTDDALSGALSDYFAPAPIILGEDPVKTKLANCIEQVADKEHKEPFQIDQGYYEGREAALMLFWQDRAANKVKVRVMDPECKNLRKPSLAKWD